ncbi:unnamed protein product [marine sediment metagenome]|uniref:Uncharacterized protein n=1 Tax=marine sediment metagenome TaxID=412755 RepID=X1R011_9ZZZZ
MKLKYNRNSELEIVGFGVYSPGWKDEVEDNLGKKMLDTGYFDEVKEKEIKRKKSKKKGDD